MTDMMLVMLYISTVVYMENDSQFCIFTLLGNDVSRSRIIS